MKVSVVIPSYNRAHRIKECLESVVNQSYIEKEIILIDNNSSDNTKNIVINNYPEVKYFFENKQGVGHARNLGIEKSSGDWIHILDSDNKFSSKNSLEHLVSLIKENKEYCDVILTSNVNENNNMISYSPLFDQIIENTTYMKTKGEFSLTASSKWYKKNPHPIVKNVIHELGLIIYFKASLQKRLFISSSVIQQYDTSETDRVSSVKKNTDQCYDLFIFYSMFLDKYSSELDVKNYIIFHFKTIVYSLITGKSKKYKFHEFPFNLLRFVLSVVPSQILLKLLNSKYK